MTVPTVIPLRQESSAERLERLAGRPLQPKRRLLFHLAARLRALETLQENERLPFGPKERAA